MSSCGLGAGGCYRCAIPFSQGRERELSALDSAMTELGLRHSTVIALKAEDSIQLQSGTVEIVSASDFLLKADL